MALLNFKMGLQANLTQNSPAIAPGTIYVTTDERAMYIDVPEKGSVAAHRIRLGDFRIYETFDALKKDKTDWSQSCLYYVADKNALARYNGTEWKLINDTASLESAIQGVASRVLALENKLDGFGTDKGSVKTYVDGINTALGSRIDGVAGRATALETAVGKAAEGNTAATGLYKEIADAEGRIETLEQFINGDESSLVGVVTDKINELDSTKSSAAVDAGKGLQVTVKQVDGLLTEVSLTGNFDEKYDAKGAGATAANTVKENLTDAIGKIDTAYKAADTLINAKLEGIDTTVVAAISTAKDAAISSANSHSDKLVSDLKGTSTKTIQQLEGEISSNDADIAALQAAVGEQGLGKRVTDLETKVDVAKVSTAIATAKSGAEATAKGYADAAEAAAKAEVTKLANGQVNANKTDIEELQTAIGDTGLGGKVSALETKVDVAKVSTAIAAAEGRAATDATKKANAAEAAAKAEVTKLADGTVAQHTSAIEDLQKAIKADGSGSVGTLIDTKLTAKVESLDSEVSSAAPTAGKGLQVTVKQENGLLDSVTVTGNFNQSYDAKGAAAAVQGKLDTVEQNLTGAINTVSGKVDTEKGRIDAILKDSTVKTFKAVEDLISSSIAANDAMVFKGIVNLTNGLPTSGMENGDTFKVGETGAYTIKASTTENAKVGDLFIYDGTAKEWRLVPSGGEDYEDPSLSASNNKIILTSGVTDQPIGSVEIVGANDCLSVSTANNKITLTLEWGTF